MIIGGSDMPSPIRELTADQADYPKRLGTCFGGKAAPILWLIGEERLLYENKVALFCSSRCPGSVILGIYDQAARWRDEGRCVISGFHSPVEQECLNILLRGKQPIIICPARSLQGMQIPAEWQKGIEAGRLLIISPFPERQKRVTSELADRRNELVLGLADEVHAAYVTSGGKLARLLEKRLIR
jgi:predicted Rossmann fold nucleotide-binding protein DprA/Smf involved in DNA uptake